MSKGLTDKLYWRWPIKGIAHCFEKVREGEKVFYESLCGRYTMERIGGQEMKRPPAMFRCGRCDGLEMTMRGHDESMPESPNWQRGANW